MRGLKPTLGQVALCNLAHRANPLKNEVINQAFSRRPIFQRSEGNLSRITGCTITPRISGVTIYETG
jgi:hypothetical protein